MVVVLEGRTGHELLRIPATGTVWSVSTLVEENDMRVAFGGECSTLVVYSLDQRKEVLELPVEEVVYDVGVTADALAYANGRRASMYGKGGTQFSWQDQPSFAVLSSLIVTMMHSEKQVAGCHCVTVTTTVTSTPPPPPPPHPPPPSLCRRRAPTSSG